MNLRRLSPLVPIVMLPLGLWLGARAFEGHDLSDVAEAIFGMPGSALLLAVAFAAASYLCLTGFDALGIRYAGRSLPYREIAEIGRASCRDRV